MFKLINEILEFFKPCIHNVKTYAWFVIVVVGFMIRPDTLGITAIVRAFGLGGLAYKCLKDFFRSSAVDPEQLQRIWSTIVSKKAPLLKINGRTVLAGDGTQRTTEGKYQPGQTKTKNHSHNQSRPSTFLGHLYGCVCVLASTTGTILGIPLFFSLQQGIKMLSVWNNKTYYSHRLRVLRDGITASITFGPTYLLLDRYFLSREILRFLDANTEPGQLDLIVRVRFDTKAYEYPPPRPKGKRGPKRKKGDDVKLEKLFENPELFTTAKLKIYGKKQEVRYHTVNLLWGQGLYRPLRFVLAEYNGHQIILASTDLTIQPEDCITAYSYRFKIEHTFKIFKNLFGGVSHHFWTKSLNQKASLSLSSDGLMELVKDPEDRQKITQTVKAMDVFTTCAAIAMGIVQILCLKTTEIDKSELPYQRTSKDGPFLSEAQMRLYLQLSLDRLIKSDPDLAVSQIIAEKKSRYGRHSDLFDSLQTEKAA